MSPQATLRQQTLLRRAAWACGATALAVLSSLAGPGGIAAASASGPRYECTTTSGGHSTQQQIQIPFRLSSTGPNTVGSTDAVMLAWPAIGSGPRPARAAVISFTAVLPVTGAQTGSVLLAGTASTASSINSRSAPLRLTAAGTDHIMPPTRFTLVVRAQQVTVLTMTCVLTTAAVTATMASSIAVQVSAGTEVMTTVPPGAPDTGGGGSLHHGVELPLLAMGGVALLAGAGFTVTGLRRRWQRLSG